MEKHVTVKYDLGHSCDFIYRKTNLHCPACGKQRVWKDRDLEDYYIGAKHVCANCKHSFYLPALELNDRGKQLAMQLKETIQEV